MIDRCVLNDLLDQYREEVACLVYNGWTRRRSPDDIRKEIDEIHDELYRQIGDD